jgi:hypothetical protein
MGRGGDQQQAIEIRLKQKQLIECTTSEEHLIMFTEDKTAQREWSYEKASLNNNHFPNPKGPPSSFCLPLVPNLHTHFDI